ncbi:two-component regulator propeller domain-containing protein [Fulvivirgaceae bacterium BMA10]|uniref:Two-component regulator propeller domain-containing protein n=1 Tax=Splendidivirga corallicola TaxID=3051826 RepID=A0ABT8KZH2_9BACT|nr:two-component regulator propeller domain-containing protein [Fulvivirgaceae bacterium BMA10]
MIRGILITVITWCLSIFVVHGQKPLNLYQLPTDGISHVQITAIYQDSQGFLWFGTVNGLNRFDGYEYKVFKHKGGDRSSLSSNYVTCIAEDKNQQLWVGTKHGLNRFDRNSQEFTSYFPDKNNPKALPGKNIEVLFLDKEKNFWIGTWNGLCRYQEQNETFELFLHDPSDPNSVSGDKINSIIQDHLGRLWIGTNFSGVTVYDPETKFFERYLHENDDDKSLSGNTIISMYEDSFREIWIGTFQRGLNRFNEKEKRFIRYKPDGQSSSIATNSVYSIMENMDRKLIIGGMQGGMSVYNRKQDTFTNYDTKGRVNIGGTAASVLCHYTLKGGEILIATSNGGVSIYDNFPSQFELYSHDPKEPGSLSINFIKETFVDKDGNIWIGTEGGGLNLFDRNHKKFKTFTKREGHSNALQDNVINVIQQDALGNLLLGTAMTGLATFDTKKNFFRHVYACRSIETETSINAINDLSIEQPQLFWIATDNGLCLYNERDEDSKKYLENDIGKVEVLKRDYEGRIWAGTEKGLYLYDPQRDIFKKYPLEVNQQNEWVASLFEDRYNRLWVSFLNDKLALLDKEKQKLDFVGVDRLVNVTNIIEDQSGFLWITAKDGLFKYELLSGEPYAQLRRSYNENDGLITTKFNANTASITKDGLLIFGSDQGLTIFHPDSIKFNPNPPIIKITDFWVEKTNTNPEETGLVEEPIDQRTDIQLNHEQNSFSIEFAALNFIKPQKNQYQYRLEGFDSTWSQISNIRRASYHEVPSGNYVFKVRASNNDGVWQKEPTELKIFVSSVPLWQNRKLQAITSVVVFISLLVWLYSYWSREQRTKKPASLLEDVKHTLFTRNSKPKEDNSAQLDKQWLERFTKIVEQQLTSKDFGIDELCRELGTSRTQLYRKVKEITDLTVFELIKEIKLEKAAQLLQKTDESVSDISFQAGFKSLSHFSKVFQEKFGSSPSQFRQK